MGRRVLPAQDRLLQKPLVEGGGGESLYQPYEVSATRCRMHAGHPSGVGEVRRRRRKRRR